MSPASTSTARVQTAIRFDPAVHERLRRAAELHRLPVNFLVERAVVDFLDHLLEPDEIVWTRTTAAGGTGGGDQ